MSNFVNALAAALQQAVKADAALSLRLAPQGLSDRTVRPQRFPALVLGTVEARELLIDEPVAAEIVLALEAWSAVSRREAEEVMTAFGMATRGLTLAAGMRLVSFDRQKTTSRRLVKEGLFVAEARFRAVIEQGSIE
ncbi:tail completion protein gp17 [Peteryoungia ipomoeae]|uniref:DUF3168 domain-containing protein n=1 Tax=Peteryoungia ipomoeae TaxID=1210932 RepID=A0A4S8NM80_9HYPH|nr:DUF3168 domain-containing protein [Peteryoungia ipomoeae]THV18070.1 DUF3168 domain-containing protein [Peteryoungia ipomoeae]